MFDDAIKRIVKLFDENNTLNLSEVEVDAIGNKKTPILKEGIKIFRGKLNGSIIFTKNIQKNDSIATFLVSLLKCLQFPGEFSLDFSGFLEDSEGYPVFVFPSPNSSLQISKDSRKIKLMSNEHIKNLIQNFQIKTNKDFEQEWFECHDSIGHFTKSGLKPARLLNVTVFFSPLFEKSENLFTYH